MEGVAGGQVGGHLRLQPVDVAAVAEQVAVQGVTAVALLVVQLQAAVLGGTEETRQQPTTLSYISRGTPRSAGWGKSRATTQYSVLFAFVPQTVQR